MKKSKQAKLLTLSKEILKRVSGGDENSFSRVCTPTEVGCDDTTDGCCIPM